MSTSPSPPSAQTNHQQPTSHSPSPSPSPAPEPRSQSRSQSRRARRRKQTTNTKQKQQQQQKQQSSKMPPVSEDPSVETEEEMKPFTLINPSDSASMPGPVTYARAQRGEIPKQVAQTGKEQGRKDIKDEDGLKLRLELNLDVEIELKASLKGEVVLALLA